VTRRANTWCFRFRGAACWDSALRLRIFTVHGCRHLDIMMYLALSLLFNDYLTVLSRFTPANVVCLASMPSGKPWAAKARLPTFYLSTHLRTAGTLGLPLAIQLEASTLTETIDQAQSGQESKSTRGLRKRAPPQPHARERHAHLRVQPAAYHGVTSRMPPAVLRRSPSRAGCLRAR